MASAAAAAACGGAHATLAPAPQLASAAELLLASQGRVRLATERRMEGRGGEGCLLCAVGHRGGHCGGHRCNGQPKWHDLLEAKGAQPMFISHRQLSSVCTKCASYRYAYPASRIPPPSAGEWRVSTGDGCTVQGGKEGTFTPETVAIVLQISCVDSSGTASFGSRVLNTTKPHCLRPPTQHASAMLGYRCAGSNLASSCSRRHVVASLARGRRGSRGLAGRVAQVDAAQAMEVPPDVKHIVFTKQELQIKVADMGR